MGSTPPGGMTNLIATTVSETAPTLNQNASLKLGIRDFTDRDANAYLYFTRPFPLKANILSAKIFFYTTAIPESGTHGFNFIRLAVGFSDSKVVYNNRPTTFIGSIKSVTKVGAQLDKTLWEIDITEWMQTVSNGGPWFGFRITPFVFENIARWIYSEIYTDPALRPRVEITWSDAPSQPAGLSPGGGRAVGLNKPVVRGSYIDVSGSVVLQFVQVQINSTDVWTAPSFDSGWQPTSVPELDLATTGYAGIGVGATVFWRIRFKDGAGVESAWSSSTSMVFDAKGTLTVSNPPIGTPTIEDATPPIAWSLSGETQSAYQIQIYHVVNGVRIIDWDTGKVTSAITSLTVPAGAINEPTSTTYTVTVRVWDTKAREATPGDPTYVEVVRDFTFVPGATTGTTALTAVPSATGKPLVVLQWTSATFPDRFNIVRNGKVIAAAIDPVDTFVSGTTHTWTDRSPSPGRQLTYQVQRVVGNVASATNSTAVTQVNSRGIWLQEPVTGVDLFLAGIDDRPMVLNAKEGVLQAIAPNSVPVAINQTLGGLEGTIQGQLVTYGGLTAQQWRDRYIQLRNMRVVTLYLTTGDYTMKCVCQEWTYEQKTTPEAMFVVTFKFYQQDAVSSILLGS